VDRHQAARYLRRRAVAGDLLGEPAARAVALHRAARAVAALSERAWAHWVAQRDGAPPALEPAVERALRRFVATGRAPDLETRLLKIPPGLFDILRIRGLGPRRVRALWREGRIVTLRQLRRACRRGTLARVPGFDEGLQTRVLAQFILARHRRTAWLRLRALEVAARREAQLREIPGVLRLERAGEMRRASELVRHLVWVIEAEAPALVLGRIAALEGARLAPDRVRLEPPDEPVQEMVVVDAAHFAARLFLETGARAHTRSVLHRLARRESVFPPGGWDESAAPALPADEGEIYARAGLAWVPPELREGRGEILAARDGTLPDLITAADLRGVFHVHTQWSDGRATIGEIAAAAIALGLEYVGIADHSRGAFYARGLDAERLAQQAEEIGRAAREFPGLRLFRGVECDILPSGALDLDERTLGALDFVIVSIHSLLDMDPAAMTRRVVRALRAPLATVLAHPSGRLFHERAGFALDWAQVYAAAADHGVALEFNTTPSRLDLDWRRIRAATRRGVRICVNPDAHRVEGLHYVAPGLETARKGWLTAPSVINTRSAVEMEEYLREKRARR
jgi:DNA polymerase (family X)